MDPVYQKLLGVLCRHLSALNAESVLRSAVRRHGLAGRHLALGDLELLVPELERGVCFFGSAVDRRRLREELNRIGNSPEGMSTKTVSIRTEQDIVVARGVARRMCEDLGARNFTIQRVATVVGELARNIVSYTAGGTIELRPQGGTTRSVCVFATDAGPGIPNLDEILSGSYRSKTGLGLGILGSKRLADHFDIQTGAGGTRVEIQITL